MPFYLLHICAILFVSETDESGAGSCASYNHPSDALNIELPQEVETLVSSSEFFQTSHLVGHEESLEQPDDLTSSTLEREGEERCDWEMDFSSQDCRGTSTGTSTNILNFFLGQPCSESQSLFLFNQDCGRDTSSSPFPSSSSVESESTHSNISIHDPIFDTMESPSMAELCEMLGDSQNVGHNDFAHMTLTGTHAAMNPNHPFCNGLTVHPDNKWCPGGVFENMTFFRWGIGKMLWGGGGVSFKYRSLSVVFISLSLGGGRSFYGGVWLNNGMSKFFLWCF